MNEAKATTTAALDLDPHKGILLLGLVGCGKTAALRFFERNARTAYRIVPARDVARRFLTEGFAVRDRHDRFVTHQMRTHLTSNLNAPELEQLYGDRLRSRLREMCNVLIFPATAPDRRR